MGGGVRSAAHPYYALGPSGHAGIRSTLRLRFGAEARQVNLVSLDAAGKPGILSEKLGAAVGLILEAERATAIVYQLPKAALVPSCFEWRNAGSHAEIPCLHRTALTCDHGVAA